MADKIKPSSVASYIGNLTNSDDMKNSFLGKMASKGLKTTSWYKEFKQAEDENEKAEKAEREAEAQEAHDKNLEVADRTSLPVVDRINMFENTLLGHLNKGILISGKSKNLFLPPPNQSLIADKSSSAEFKQIQATDSLRDEISENSKANTQEIVNALTEIYKQGDEQSKFLKTISEHDGKDSGGALGDMLDGKGKGKAGKLGKFLGSHAGKIAGGIGGLAGGLALDYAGDKLKESGHEKLGAGADIGSSALTGAGMGAMFGPAGMAVGGALGAAYGTYNNWDTLTGDTKPEQKQQVDANGVPLKENSDGTQPKPISVVKPKEKGMFDSISVSFNKGLSSVGKTLKNVYIDTPKKALTSIGEFGKKSAKSVSTGFNKAWDSFTETGDKATKGLEKTSKGMFDSFGKGASSLFAGIGGLASSIGSSIGGAVSSGAHAVGQGATDLWDGAKGIAEKGIGAIAGHFESGKLGAGAVSTGKGDLGGASYGTHQFASKTGSLQAYLSHSKYKDQFKGLTAGSAEFNQKWKDVNASDPKGFAQDQEEHITRTHYKPQADKIKKDTGIDVGQKSDALKSAVYSIGVQFGGGSGLVGKALAEAKLDPKTAKDADIIKAIYAYKKNHNDTLFGKSSADVRKGTLNRASNEEKMVLSALEKEQATGGDKAIDKTVNKDTPLVASKVDTKPSVNVEKPKSTKISKEEKRKLLAEKTALEKQNDPKNKIKLTQINSRLADAGESPEVNHLKAQGVTDPMVIMASTGIEPMKKNITPTSDITPKTEKVSKGASPTSGNTTIVKNGSSSNKSPAVAPRYDVSNRMITVLAIM